MVVGKIIDNKTKDLALVQNAALAIDIKVLKLGYSAGEVV